MEKGWFHHHTTSIAILNNQPHTLSPPANPLLSSSNTQILSPSHHQPHPTTTQPITNLGSRVHTIAYHLHKHCHHSFIHHKHWTISTCTNTSTTPTTTAQHCTAPSLTTTTAQHPQTQTLPQHPQPVHSTAEHAQKHLNSHLRYSYLHSQVQMACLAVSFCSCSFFYFFRAADVSAPLCSPYLCMFLFTS